MVYGLLYLLLLTSLNSKNNAKGAKQKNNKKGKNQKPLKENKDAVVKKNLKEEQEIQVNVETKESSIQITEKPNFDGLFTHFVPKPKSKIKNFSDTNYSYLRSYFMNKNLVIRITVVSFFVSLIVLYLIYIHRSQDSKNAKYYVGALFALTATTFVVAHFILRSSYLTAIEDANAKVKANLKKLSISEIASNFFSNYVISTEKADHIIKAIVSSTIINLKKEKDESEKSTPAILICGPSGIGKTYLTKQIASACNVTYTLVRGNDFGTFSDGNTKKLLECLTIDNVLGIICIDELDKMHESYVKILLSLIETGKLQIQLSQNELTVIDLSRKVIIFTSNMACDLQTMEEKMQETMKILGKPFISRISPNLIFHPEAEIIDIKNFKENDIRIVFNNCIQSIFDQYPQIASIKLGDNIKNFPYNPDYGLRSWIKDIRERILILCVQITMQLEANKNPSEKNKKVHLVIDFADNGEFRVDVRESQE